MQGEPLLPSASAARAMGGIITVNSGTEILPFPWMDIENSFFGIKEALGLYRAEIAQIQMMLLHHPCGSGPKLAGAAGDHNKANVKQHRSSEQVISSPDSNAGLIFSPLKLSFLLLFHYFLKQCMGDQIEQRRWDSHFVLAGKSSETGAPDAL